MKEVDLMKEKFIPAEIDIVVFETEDIITASGPIDLPDDEW